MTFLLWILRVITIPVALLYGMIIEFRNILYDIGVFKTFRFSVPVISVGNLTAGGSGKTPLTILLARHFCKTRRVAVVSRGYGRKSKGVKLVSNGEKIFLNADEAGDEPLLIAKSVNQAIVMVAEKRKDAMERLLPDYNPGLILLDDAFQHRSVARDVDLVLLNRKERHGWKLPLPAGRLREFWHNLGRASMIILTNMEEGEKPDIRFKDIPVFVSQPHLDTLVDAGFEPAGRISDLEGQSVFAFCGIANPELFFKMLRDQGIKIEGTRTFRDHYRYRVQDLEEIIEKSGSLDCRSILCTEKDLIKIRKLLPRTSTRICAIRLSIVIREEDVFFKQLGNHIDKV
jgi:tetraacyldisaccharide 4'-kinase